MHAFHYAADELPLSGLGQLGAVGTILAILLTFGWYVYKRERDRADKNEAELARLNASLIDKHAIAMEKAFAILSEVKELLLLIRDAPPPRRRP